MVGSRWKEKGVSQRPDDLLGAQSVCVGCVFALHSVDSRKPGNRRAGHDAAASFSKSGRQLGGAALRDGILSRADGHVENESAARPCGHGR